MSTRQYKACLASIPNQGRCPVSFLDAIIDNLNPLPDPVFAPNAITDIYSIVSPILGPWTGILHRKAAMCEVLRVTAAFESGWTWNEGADTTAGPETSLQEEAGAWQVSANSMPLSPDGSLSQCVLRHAGKTDPLTFIAAMKSNHPLAVEYVARLFRFNTRWSGPTNRGWTAQTVSRAAVAEFQTFLTP